MNNRVIVDFVYVLLLVALVASFFLGEWRWG